MKRLKVWLLLPLLLLLVACSKSPKEEFKARLQESSQQDKVAYQYKVKVKDIQLTSTSSTSGLDLSALRNASLDFTINQDLKNGKVSLSSDLSKINSALPKAQLIYAKKKAYLNADALVAFYGLDKAAFQGKYVDLSEFSQEKFPDLSKLEKENNKKSDLSWLDDLSDKKFEKSGDKVTATFTFDELLEATSKTTKKDEEAKTYIDLAKAAISDKSKIKMTLGKDGSGSADMNLIYAKGVDYGVKSIKLTMSYKKVTYKSVKTPSKDNLLDKNQLQELVVQNYKFTDEQFNGIYDTLRENASLYSKAELQEIINGYKQNLTDDQLNKLNALLNQATA